MFLKKSGHFLLLKSRVVFVFNFNVVHNRRNFLHLFRRSELFSHKGVCNKLNKNCKKNHNNTIVWY